MARLKNGEMKDPGLFALSRSQLAFLLRVLYLVVTNVKLTVALLLKRSDQRHVKLRQRATLNTPTLHAMGNDLKAFDVKESTWQAIWEYSQSVPVEVMLYRCVPGRLEQLILTLPCHQPQHAYLSPSIASLPPSCILSPTNLPPLLYPSPRKR